MISSSILTDYARNLRNSGNSSVRRCDAALYKGLALLLEHAATQAHSKEVLDLIAEIDADLDHDVSSQVPDDAKMSVRMGTIRKINKLLVLLVST